MGVDIQKIKDQVLQYSDQLERVKAGGSQGPDRAGPDAFAAVDRAA